MDCREIENVFSAYIDRELDNAQREVFDFHLESCSKCKIFIDELKQQDENLHHFLAPYQKQAKIIAERFSSQDLPVRSVFPKIRYASVALLLITFTVSAMWFYRQNTGENAVIVKLAQELQQQRQKNEQREKKLDVLTAKLANITDREAKLWLLQKQIADNVQKLEKLAKQNNNEARRISQLTKIVDKNFYYQQNQLENLTKDNKILSADFHKLSENQYRFLQNARKILKNEKLSDKEKIDLEKSFDHLESEMELEEDFEPADQLEENY